MMNVTLEAAPRVTQVLILQKHYDYHDWSEAPSISLAVKGYIPSSL